MCEGCDGSDVKCFPTKCDCNIFLIFVFISNLFFSLSLACKDRINNKTEYTEEEKAFIKQCKENKKLKNERKVKEKEKEKTCERIRLWY